MIFGCEIDCKILTSSINASFLEPDCFAYFFLSIILIANSLPLDFSTAILTEAKVPLFESNFRI